MTDPVRDWVIQLGADSKAADDVKYRMRFLCKHFRLVELAGGSKGTIKRMFKPVREALIRNKDVDRDQFVSLCLSSISSPKKWDLDHIGFARSKTFYQSQRWKNLRIKALALHQSCLACGRSPSDGIVLHVDHILSRTIYPEYALDLNNLQVLCAECNMGKVNVMTKDFR